MTKLVSAGRISTMTFHLSTAHLPTDHMMILLSWRIDLTKT
jgi:hypothetical protein